MNTFLIQIGCSYTLGEAKSLYTRDTWLDVAPLDATKFAEEQEILFEDAQGALETLCLPTANLKNHIFAVKGIPSKFLQDGELDPAVWDYIAFARESSVPAAAIVEAIEFHEIPLDKVEAAYQGEFSDVADLAYKLAEEAYASNPPESFYMQYFDSRKYAKKLFSSGELVTKSTKEHGEGGGHVFSTNY